MRVKSRLLAAGASISLLALSACGQDAGASAEADGPTVTIDHAQGSTAVPVNPQTVYTFDLGVLDSMEALGLEADGVPEAEFPQSLAKYEDAKYTKIGSMKEPDFEAISAGDPDLIIISGRTAGSYEELSKIAPTVDLSVDTTKPLESFTEQTQNLGRIFDAEDRVNAKLDAIDTQIEDTKAQAADAGKGLVIMTSGGEVTAYGSNSRFGLVHDVLGVPTAAEVKAEGAHGESVSFEYVKETNPDLLFMVDRDTAMGTEAAAASAVLDNDLVKSTKAARNDKIIALDSSSWYLVGYGLNNLPKMIDAVATAL
ncbi:siderophore ABC transporter substrate-binding protein [Arthrobacter sp. I2-34]|uniref:Siderophore ABC transporter substrate-binding protein n=1 Tax=Arthrobacter hankyongi TaxID=2904801 RepID=A0ABS9L5A2_9MICC|nr:siderophore ABC transporter substrate-binding protein [Arthrobacter hankyongi]MCG2621723.1 siderophore ABC transporter substrate-binding protein [Arthrobacter hankyongi]